MRRVNQEARCQIFINPAGQRDNIGDSVLRRPYLDTLRKAGRLHVLVHYDDDYASGLGLSDQDVQYRSSSAWLRAAFKSALRRELVFAVNAGEYVGTSRELFRSVWQPAVALFSRLMGGKVVLAGSSIRAGTSVRFTHLRLLSRLAVMGGSWRDPVSHALVGRGSTQPDWAFITGSELPVYSRCYLSIVARGDRPLPSYSWLTMVAAFARREGLEPRVIVQVRRDVEHAKRMAEILQCSVLDWPEDRNHAAQEAVVREQYRSSEVILSDRIHALIIGVTEGAVPLPFSTGEFSKIQRTLGDRLSVAMHNLHSVEDLPDFRLFRANLEYDVARSVSELRSLGCEIVAAIGDAQ